MWRGKNETFIFNPLVFRIVMACYCWNCGTEAYKGYRDYKCENPDCELYKQPIFPAEKQMEGPEATAEPPGPTGRRQHPPGRRRH